MAQVLGRNLEGLVTRAQELKEQWKDQFVSVEHLVLAFADDSRFGRSTLQNEGLSKSALETAIKDMRGSNKVTDQVSQRMLSKCSSRQAFKGLSQKKLLAWAWQAQTSGEESEKCIGSIAADLLNFILGFGPDLLHATLQLRAA